MTVPTSKIDPKQYPLLSKHVKETIANRKGVIYLIGYNNSSPVKIGFSYSFTERLRKIQNLNPYRFVVFGLIEGNKEKELKIHRHFVSFRLGNSEFFKPDNSIFEYFYLKGNFYDNPFGTDLPYLKFGGF